VSIRLYIYAAIALALGGLLWHDHHQTQRANRLAGELNQANANLKAERENTRKSNESAKRLQDKNDALETDRRNNPLPAVRVCKRAVVPEARTTAVVDEAPQANDAPEDAGDRDIGPALDDFATDAEANLNQCNELIEWVRNR
jgi:hypothetical protein